MEEQKSPRKSSSCIYIYQQLWVWYSNLQAKSYRYEAVIEVQETPGWLEFELFREHHRSFLLAFFLTPLRAQTMIHIIVPTIVSVNSVACTLPIRLSMSSADAVNRFFPLIVAGGSSVPNWYDFILSWLNVYRSLNKPDSNGGTTVFRLTIAGWFYIFCREQCYNPHNSVRPLYFLSPRTRVKRIYLPRSTPCLLVSSSSLMTTPFVITSLTSLSRQGYLMWWMSWVAYVNRPMRMSLLGFESN